MSTEIIDVFLCHNGADKAWVKQLAEQIESETMDGTKNGRPLRVFFDEWDIDIGHNFVQSINRALARARFVALVITPEFIASQWPTAEWTHLVAQDPNNRDNRLIPILRRERAAKEIGANELPLSLKALVHIDFRDDTKFNIAFRQLIRRLREQSPARGDKLRPIATNSKTKYQNVSKTSIAMKTFRIRGNAPALGRQLVGRESDLKSIKSLLSKALNKESVGIVVVQGAAGVGKSALLNYVSQDDTLSSMFPDGGLWAAVGDESDISLLLRSWGQVVKLSGAQMTRISETVGALRAKLRGRRLLLLVDDVWRDSDAECFRVAGAGSVVLYTTRMPDVAQRLATNLDFVYCLRGLKTKESLALLAEIIPDIVREHGSLCKTLVKSVDGLPLAIVIAGKMLKREIGDVEQLLLAIQFDARLLLEQPVPPDMVDLLNQTTPNVAAVLRCSTEALDPKHKWYFARLGAFQPTPATFDLKLAAHCWNLGEPEAKRIIKFFVDLGLLEMPKRGQFQIHPLMQALALGEWELLNEQSDLDK